jgi:hypothetical protein
VAEWEERLQEVRRLTQLGLLVEHFEVEVDALMRVRDLPLVEERSAQYFA